MSARRAEKRSSMFKAADSSRDLSIRDKSAQIEAEASNEKIEKDKTTDLRAYADPDGINAQRRGSRSLDLDSRRANCRDINHTTHALPLHLPAIVLSRDSHRQYLTGQHNSRRRAAIVRAMYLRDRNNITPDPTTRRRGRGTVTGLHSPLEQCSSRYSTIKYIRLGEIKMNLRYLRISKSTWTAISWSAHRKEKERRRNRLSVDIFHGKWERIHGCSAKGKEAIKSAHFDSYFGKNKNDFTFPKSCDTME
ncbi:hypothetical protein ALC53_06368 [Atta colombica]|uniref:Uncharacterized protein n=1 Tax=Atta colombica TaxID=520822 RepID=A0A195BFZ3_9HYME|nr:hypothetical protein ALC53_06368 [Atta colombica]